jgi:hypothetical protein
LRINAIVDDHIAVAVALVFAKLPNVRPECGVVRSNSYLAGHFDRSLSVKEQTKSSFELIVKIKLSSIIIKNRNMSNILREKNFNVRQLSHTVRHKAHVHAFGLRVVKAMVLAQ